MKQPSRLNLRNLSFSHRVADDWNCLPSKVVVARDVEQFRAELDEAWEDNRLLHTVPQIPRESDLNAGRLSTARCLQMNTSGEYSQHCHPVVQPYLEYSAYYLSIETLTV